MNWTSGFSHKGDEVTVRGYWATIVEVRQRHLLDPKIEY
jgi:hypothetical protein